MRILAAVVVMAVLLLAGCETPIGPKTLKWTTVQSPQTGRCYEVATYYFGTQNGVMAMAEIPCGEMGKKTSQRRAI